MGVLFGSEEWLDFFVDSLRHDPRFQELAGNYEEGPMVLKTRADPSIHEIFNHDVRMYFDAYRGQIREARVLAPGEEAEAWLVLEGSYGTWKQLATGRLGLKKAVLMTRQLKIKGPRVTQLMKYLPLAERIIGVLSESRSRYVFPDEASF